MYSVSLGLHGVAESRERATQRYDDEHRTAAAQDGRTCSSSASGTVSRVCDCDIRACPRGCARTLVLAGACVVHE